MCLITCYRDSLFSLIFLLVVIVFLVFLGVGFCSLVILCLWQWELVGINVHIVGNGRFCNSLAGKYILPQSVRCNIRNNNDPL